MIDISLDDEVVSERQGSCMCAADALVLSVANLGRVDLDYIAGKAGITPERAIAELKGSIYQNPQRWGGDPMLGWETSDEYLSGNLAEKFYRADKAEQIYNGRFYENLRALKKLLPPMVSAEDIYISLGSPWVPEEVINDFMEYIALDQGVYTMYAEQFRRCNGRKKIIRHPFTGMCRVKVKTCPYSYDGKVPFTYLYYQKYGTSRMAFPYILEHALNMTPIVITDPKSRYDSVNRVVNAEETLKANEKKNELIKLFQDWVWTDVDRAKKLKRIYYGKYACHLTRRYNGDFLPFTGMSKDVELYDYQKNAVARILLSPNTLLAHDVGSGKTFEMIAAGMELRRIHPGHKNMYVVPNNIMGQWEGIFRMMYPGVDLFIINKKNFTPKKRQTTLEEIRDRDCDAVLIPYSCFDMIRMSPDYYYRRNKTLRSKLHASSGDDIPDLARKLKSLEANIAKQEEEMSEELPGGLYFENLGVNTLFVDEAHNYKNARSVQEQAELLGKVSNHRADTMMDKVHYVQRSNNGGGVVFATGTPVTNSLTDLYVMQRFLQEGELEMKGMSGYRAWLGMFATETTTCEIDVDTTRYKTVTKYSTFNNIPELTAMIASVTDFHEAEGAPHRKPAAGEAGDAAEGKAEAGTQARSAIPGSVPPEDDTESGTSDNAESGTAITCSLPAFSGYTDTVLEGTGEFTAYLKQISKRADDVRSGNVKPTEDNMLKITTDGRKAALDMRLVKPLIFGSHGSKAAACADNVLKVYNRTRSFRGTQLVFCDISTPKKGFNLYDELKALLVAGGIPKKQIAFIHNYEKDEEREQLFDDVREGRVSVLIGSTAKLGHGVNVQTRLAAIHHLDVPWRPSDMVQREGRILRQGNTCPYVEIYRYITKNSFDAYSWQLLENKQRFISQVMGGEAKQRSAEDIEDTTLTYAEVKALAVGNPDMKRKVELTNELSRLRILQKNYRNGKAYMAKELLDIPGKIAQAELRAANCRKDIAAYDDAKAGCIIYNQEDKKALREKIFGELTAYRNMPQPKVLEKYMGFDLEAPAGMMPKMILDKRTGGIGRYVYYMYVVGAGRYYLEIETEAGALTRVNNLLEDLPERLVKLESTVESYKNREAFLKEMLDKPDNDYMSEISRIEAEIAKLDEKLGVA